MAFTISGSLIVDETSGTQNLTDGGSDTSGNDVAGGLGNLGLNVPQFDALLAEVAFGFTPTNVSVSNANADNSTGSSLLTNLGDNVTNIAFTDANGDPFDGTTDSGLTTTDGTKIYLYSYDTALYPDLAGVDENNVVFGRRADANGDPDDTGAIVFAAYLQPTGAADVALASDADASGAKVWLVEYEPLFHADDTDHDDAVSPTGVLYITVDANGSFDLTGAPSGQNLFLMYGEAGDGNPNTDDSDKLAIVVTAKNAASGGSVNTGQAGGGTTIGSNNQMLDPGEGLTFTFVSDANPNFTVPNLSGPEAGKAENIQFGGVHASDTASFTVVQTQPASKTGTLQLAAFTTAKETGAAYISGLGGDTPVAITSVTVTDANGNVVTSGVSLVNGIVKIIGVDDGYHIEYTAVGHNRVQIDNIGLKGSGPYANFDIGDFSIPQPSSETLPFDALVFQDDGPVASLLPVTSAVDEDGLAGGNPGGLGDDKPATNSANTSGNILALFTAGVDGLAHLGLVIPAVGDQPSLTSQGAAVKYAVNVAGDTLTAYVDSGPAGFDAGDRKVFTLVIDNPDALVGGIPDPDFGHYTFTLLDQLDHPLTNDLGTPATETSFEDELALDLSAFVQATDGDGDKATATTDQFVITVDDDSPDEMTPAGLEVQNKVGESNDAALGSWDKVGADEPGTASFVNTHNDNLLRGYIQDGTPVLENLKIGTSTVYLEGFGTDTLTAKTSVGDSTVFVMTLNPDALQANDRYDITMSQAFANTQVLEFGSELFVDVAPGNPDFYLVENIDGSVFDALFSASDDANNGSAQTVNISTTGVGVGNQSMGLGDRLHVQFLEDDGNHDTVVTPGEVQLVNQFKFTLVQNNPPGQVADAWVEAFAADGITKVAITSVLINGTNVLLGPVASNDQNKHIAGTEVVTAVSDGSGGWYLYGLGGGTGGQGPGTLDNDSIEIIAATDYARVDVTGIAGLTDDGSDTFDMLINSIAISTPYDVTFTVQADLTDYDGDTSDAVDLDVALLVGVVV